ncbi:transposase [Nonomuraea sp. SYSU D8015]|uniref:transposase n=1 Tax=Nonomuraea sp. SYSU D8015 TaxID=2593644 RepID=UPI001660268D|nr:transposase [Nonomuraea sp. SYSU D8015]
MVTWHGPDGIQIDAITLDQRAVLKITQQINGRTYTLGYCRHPREVAVYVDLADLVEVIPFPQGHRLASRPS